MRTLFIALLSLMLFAFLPKNKLVGRWAGQPSEKGNVTSAYFREDGTFEGYINRKPFTSGQYTLRDDTLRFTDNGCGNVEGVYRVLFYAGNDSLRFKSVSDTCTERRKGMERLVMGREKMSNQ